MMLLYFTLRTTVVPKPLIPVVEAVEYTFYLLVRR